MGKGFTHLEEHLIKVLKHGRFAEELGEVHFSRQTEQQRNDLGVLRRWVQVELLVAPCIELVTVLSGRDMLPGLKAHSVTQLAGVRGVTCSMGNRCTCGITTLWDPERVDPGWGGAARIMMISLRI